MYKKQSILKTKSSHDNASGNKKQKRRNNNHNINMTNVYDADIHLTGPRSGAALCICLG